MNQLNAYLALEIMHDHMERAERHRRARPSREQPPGPRHVLDTRARDLEPRPRFARRLRRAFAVLRRASATLGDLEA